MARKLKVRDEDLIRLIHRGNEDALYKLIERYRPFAWKMAHDYYDLNKDSGITLEEFMQVAFSSVQVAVTKYVNNNDAFYPYWKVVAKNEIIRFIEKNSYKAGAQEFKGVSLDEQLDNNVLIADVVGKEDKTLGEDTIVEEFKELLNSKECGLTKNEIKIANYLLKGYTVNEMSKLTKWSQSKIYYLSSQVKTKLYNIIINRYFK